MRPYIKLLILLFSAFIVMTVFSELSEVRLFGHKIVTMQSFLTHDTINDSVEFCDVDTTNDVIANDTLPRVLLFVGDSMVEGLSSRLGAYAYHNGHKLYTVIWYGSSTEKWAESGKLSMYIESYKPDYVFICLGGNELFVRNADERRKYVRSIVSEIDSLPFIWIGPPNWKDDTGINEVIRSEIGDKRFFLSKGMRFDRAADGMHPTEKSSCEWMDSVVCWMKRQMPHPKMEIPAEKVRKPYKTIVLTPDD